MILAAGLGSRLTPLTLDVPKPLIPIMNRPIIQIIMSKLYDIGVNELVINTHHLADRLEKEVSFLAPSGMKLTFSYEPTLLGGGGALKKVEAFFGDETFLLVNGDIFFNFDLEDALNSHKKNGALATLLLKENEDTNKYGVVGIDTFSQICLFPYGVSGGEPSKRGVFCGIHILEPEIFSFIPENSFFCINQGVYPPMIHAKKRVCGYFVKDGYWKDLGTLAEYLQSHWDLLSGKVEKNGTYFSVAEECPDACIEEGSVITPPVLIGKNTVIRRGAFVGPYAVLGKDNTVESGVEVSNSIIWDNVTLEKGVKVHGAVISHKVHVKEGVALTQGDVIREHTLINHV